MRTCILLIVACVLLASAFVTGCKPAATTSSTRPAFAGRADNSKCLSCHAAFKSEKHTLRHAKVGIGCVRCHGPSADHVKDEEPQAAPDIMYARNKVPAMCITCHDQAKLARKHLWRGVKPDYDGVKNACTDCHGKHRLEKRTVRWDRDTRKPIPASGPAQGETKS